MTERRTTTEAEMREWAASGKSWADLARAIGRHPADVSGAAALLGIRSATYVQLDDAKRGEIATLVSSGVRVTEAARKAGVARSTVVRHGRVVPGLEALAARINTHLTRLEADAAWNVRPGGGRRLYLAHARRAGNRIAVTYVSYQGRSTITRDEAERYLAKLDGGFKGRHFEALREGP